MTTLLGRVLRGASRLAMTEQEREVRMWGSGGGVLGGSRRTVAGPAVDETSALTLAAVYRAISVLSETTCTLPLNLSPRPGETGTAGAAGDGRERAADHPAQALLDNPNPVMDGMTFREHMMTQLVGRGNAYAEVVWGVGTDGAYRPVLLWPIPAQQVKPKLRPGTVEKYYEVRKPGGGAPVLLEPEEMLHLRDKGDQLEGWSRIRLARESIGMGLGAERFGAAQLGNGNAPSGVFKFKRRPAQEVIDDFKGGWRKDHGGPENAGKVGMLWGEDVDWLSTSINNVDAQHLETRVFQVVEIARWFGVPPHLLYELSRATFSNIEHQGLEYLMYSLAYWLRKWTVALGASVLLPAERREFYFEHLTAALLMTDTKTRYEVHAIARQWGINDANEIRRKENEPARTDGADLIVPSGSVRAADLGKAPPATPPVKMGEVPAAPEAPTAPAPAAPLAAIAAGENALRRAWLGDTLGRMIRKEVAKIATLAKDPGTFLDKAEAFYEHHRVQLAEALTPALGDAAAAATLTKHHCDLSFAEVLDASGAAPSRFAASLEKTLSRWPDRAAATAEELLPSPP